MEEKKINKENRTEYAESYIKIKKFLNENPTKEKLEKFMKENPNLVTQISKEIMVSGYEKFREFLKKNPSVEKYFNQLENIKK